VRTSLLPGLLKTINSNKHHSVPMKIFEVSDVGFIDMEQERKSKNERHFAAAIMGKTSGFEQVHGLLDRLMLMLRSTFITRENGLKNDQLEGYWIEEVNGKSDIVLLGDCSLTYCRPDVPCRSLSGYQAQPRRQEPHYRCLWHFASECLAEIRVAVRCTKSINTRFYVTDPTFRYPVSTVEFNLEVFL
jgi:hypothetical protein